MPVRAEHKNPLWVFFAKEPALKAGSPISMVTSMVKVWHYRYNTGGVEEI